MPLKNLSLVALMTVTGGAPATSQLLTYSIEATLVGGPHAGTYRVKPSQPCSHLATGLDFSQTIERMYDEAAADKALRDPKSLNAIRVVLPDWDGKSEPKGGRVWLAFGPVDQNGAKKGATIYEVDTSARPPAGQGMFKASDTKTQVSVEFDGVTAGGTKLRLKAMCTNPVI